MLSDIVECFFYVYCGSEESTLEASNSKKRQVLVLTPLVNKLSQTDGPASYCKALYVLSIPCEDEHLYVIKVSEYNIVSFSENSKNGKTS